MLTWEGKQFQGGANIVQHLAVSLLVSHYISLTVFPYDSGTAFSKGCPQDQYIWRTAVIPRHEYSLDQRDGATKGSSSCWSIARSSYWRWCRWTGTKNCSSPRCSCWQRRANHSMCMSINLALRSRLEIDYRLNDMFRLNLGWSAKAQHIINLVDETKIPWSVMEDGSFYRLYLIAYSIEGRSDCWFWQDRRVKQLQGGSAEHALNLTLTFN